MYLIEEIRISISLKDNLSRSNFILSNLQLPSSVQLKLTTITQCAI